jgi:propanediol utilization protein
VLPGGVICARRHVHVHAGDAARLGLRDGSLVAVRLGPPGDEVIYRAVRCRVSEHFTTQLHLDVDEANAARVGPGDRAELLTDDGGASRGAGAG